MSRAENFDAPAVDLSCELEAPPEKVWRALTIPAYLDRWLLPTAGADGAMASRDANMAETIRTEVIEAEPPRHLRLRWRENGTGAVEDSVVTFTLLPTPEGGTWLRLVHERQTASLPASANSNGAVLALAA